MQHSVALFWFPLSGNEFQLIYDALTPAERPHVLLK